MSANVFFAASAEMTLTVSNPDKEGFAAGDARRKTNCGEFERHALEFDPPAKEGGEPDRRRDAFRLGPAERRQPWRGLQPDAGSLNRKIGETRYPKRPRYRDRTAAPGRKAAHKARLHRFLVDKEGKRRRRDHKGPSENAEQS